MTLMSASFSQDLPPLLICTMSVHDQESLEAGEPFRAGPDRLDRRVRELFAIHHLVPPDETVCLAAFTSVPSRHNQVFAYGSVVAEIIKEAVITNAIIVGTGDLMDLAMGNRGEAFSLIGLTAEQKLQQIFDCANRLATETSYAEVRLDRGLTLADVEGFPGRSNFPP